MNSIITRPSPDTVKFFIPCSTEQLDAMPFASRTINTFFPPGQEDSDRLRFTFWPFTLQELDNLPSSYSYPALAPSYASDSPGLALQISIPKLLRGHSLWHPTFTDFQNAIQGIYEALKRVWFDCPPLSTWRILRLDLSVNLQCENLKQVQDFRQQLSRLRYLNKDSTQNSKKRAYLCYWAGRSKTIKFYSKGLEILGTDSVRSYKVVDATGKDTLAGQALQVLRFEVEYHRDGLLSALKVPHSKNLTLSAVLDWYEALDYNTWFESYMQQFDRPGPQSNLHELHEKLSLMPKPSVYQKFCREMIDFGLDWVQENYSQSTYYYRVSQLRKYGIEPAHLQSHWARCTAYQLPQMVSLRSLPIHPGRVQSEPVDDFSFLVQQYVNGSIAFLKKSQEVTPCRELKNA